MLNKMTKYKLVLGSVMLALLTAFFSIPASAVDFTRAEKIKLKQGKTVLKYLPTSGQKGFYGGSGYALINAPVDEVWKIVTSWQLYPKMFPNTESCTPLSTKGNKTLLRMKLGHPVVNLHFHAETTTNEADKSMYFRLIPKYPHDVDSMTGYWKLFPQTGGRTLAAYVVSVKVPAGLIAIAGDDLTDRAIRSLLKLPGYIKKWIEHTSKMEAAN